MYPWIADSDLPLVDYTTNDKGEHLVVFRDESQDGKLTYATIKADVVLAVAYKMCKNHVDTEWAIRHLESKGYSVKKRTAASYGPRLSGWARLLGLGR